MTMQKVETIKNCSKRVIERQLKPGGWLTILECGHERFVRHYREHHICSECQRQKANERSSTYAWTLQTQSGFILVKGRMFKPLAQACFDELERFPNKQNAVVYSQRLKLSYPLLAVKLQTSHLKKSA
jgi:hypothetical protein